MPIRPVVLQRCADVPEQLNRVRQLVIGIDDENGVEAARRQAWVVEAALHVVDVSQTLATDAALDRLEHLRLKVLREDRAVGSDPSCQPDREPAAAGADIGHDRPFTDTQRVHDQVGLLPRVPVGTFEHAQTPRG